MARLRRILVLAAVMSSAACASTLQQAREAESIGDMDTAERLYRDALSQGGGDVAAARDGVVQILLARGREAGKDDPAEAERIYREVLELDASSTKGRLGLARALLKQDRQEEAMQQLDERGGCNGCGRLLAILLVERAEQRMANERWEEARADLEQSLQLLPDASAALRIVETYRATNAAALAVEAMEKAVPLIKEGNVESQHAFTDLRRQLVLAAAESGDIALVDRYFTLSPPGAGGDDWFSLQLEVARERVRRGDRDFSIQRLADLLKQDGDEMAPSRKAEMEKLLVDLYSSRAAQALREGEVAKAENDLTYALRIDPDAWTIKLQRVLAVVAMGKLDHSFRMIEKIPAGTEGRKEVSAILWSLRVNEELTNGNIDAARRALDNANAAHADMPEVHVAAAQLLALTPIEGLPGRAEREMKKSGLMRYPAGHLNRYGEALSELDWARAQSGAMGPRYPYRGPSTDERMASLERQIRRFYPFEIKFQADATTELVLRAAETRSVVVEAPGSFRQEVTVSKENPARVTIPEPGLTRLRMGRKTVALITEPYTRLTADL